MANKKEVWNQESVIACQFSFRRPKLWSLLSPTETGGLRHCPECDRDVHLALTEEEFRRHASEGVCVAVRVFQADMVEGDNKQAFYVGNAEVPYGD